MHETENHTDDSGILNLNLEDLSNEAQNLEESEDSEASDEGYIVRSHSSKKKRHVNTNTFLLYLLKWKVLLGIILIALNSLLNHSIKIYFC